MIATSRDLPLLNKLGIIMNKVKHSGGCHCGAVRFEVYASPDLDVIHCRLVAILSQGLRGAVAPFQCFVHSLLEILCMWHLSSVQYPLVKCVATFLSCTVPFGKIIFSRLTPWLRIGEFIQ